MQFAPALCSFMVATCAAWKARSASLHGPGTTITGVTLPSSLVIVLSRATADDRVVGALAAGEVDRVDAGVRG